MTAEIAQLELDDHRQLVHGTNIRTEVFPTANHSTVRIQAPRGVADLHEGRVRLEGGVEVNETSGRTLKTGAVVWTHSDQRLRSDGLVEVIGVNFSGNGGTSEADFEASKGRKVRVDGPVRLWVQPDETDAR